MHLHSPSPAIASQYGIQYLRSQYRDLKQQLWGASTDNAGTLQQLAEDKMEPHHLFQLAREAKANPIGTTKAE